MKVLKVSSGVAPEIDEVPGDLRGSLGQQK